MTWIRNKHDLLPFLASLAGAENLSTAGAKVSRMAGNEIDSAARSRPLSPLNSSTDSPEIGSAAPSKTQAITDSAPPGFPVATKPAGLSRQEKGRYGEEIAARVLKQQGYQILEQNWHSRYGEIDVIATDTQKLIFVEVKYRTTQQYGGGVSAIDLYKYQRLKALALLWLEERRLSGRSFRIDGFIVEEKPGGTCHYQHWKGIA